MGQGFHELFVHLNPRIVQTAKAEANLFIPIFRETESDSHSPWESESVQGLPNPAHQARRPSCACFRRPCALPEQHLETGLLEMLVTRQHVLNVFLLHHYE
jgi:hypothetical protein